MRASTFSKQRLNVRPALWRPPINKPIKYFFIQISLSSTYLNLTSSLSFLPNNVRIWYGAIISNIRYSSNFQFSSCAPIFNRRFLLLSNSKNCLEFWVIFEFCDLSIYLRSGSQFSLKFLRWSQFAVLGLFSNFQKCIQIWIKLIVPSPPLKKKGQIKVKKHINIFGAFLNRAYFLTAILRGIATHTIAISTIWSCIQIGFGGRIRKFSQSITFQTCFCFHLTLQNLAKSFK